MIDSYVAMKNAEPDMPKLRILVAEDDRVNQRLIAARLELFGQKVATASNGRETVERCSKEQCDLILMDLQMPEIDGYEATLQIRKQEYKSGGHTRIIAITGSVMPDTEQRCLATGMDQFLAKPID
jgi:CheY-like chemotaxis protein